jgi:hypothetical protein
MNADGSVTLLLQRVPGYEILGELGRGAMVGSDWWGLASRSFSSVGAFDQRLFPRMRGA